MRLTNFKKMPLDFVSKPQELESITKVVNFRKFKHQIFWVIQLACKKYKDFRTVYMHVLKTNTAIHATPSNGFGGTGKQKTFISGGTRERMPKLPRNRVTKQFWRKGNVSKLFQGLMYSSFKSFFDAFVC